MREALILARPSVKGSTPGANLRMNAIDRALAPDAGRALLAEVERLRAEVARLRAVELLRARLERTNDR
jgi:predicted aconitase with swiveling domain